MNTDLQIKAIEEEIRKTPYHKGTERHIGMLRARIAVLKDKQIESQSKGGGGGGGYAVKKQGDATVVLVGPPSAGKSTLINALTNAESKVAPYAFTTVSVIPGMMHYRHANIQILDVPGLIEGAEEGKGRGREVLSVVRGADLLVLITDLKRPHVHANIVAALERNGIRVNKRPPRIRVEKRLNGGLSIQSNIRQDLDRETIKDVISQMGIKNADVYLDEKITLDMLIDSLSRNRVYAPSIFVFNKSDDEYGVHKEIDGRKVLFISAEKRGGLEEFKQDIWASLGFITVFLVKPGEDPTEENPMVSKSGSTLKDLVNEIGGDFAQSKTGAKLWGPGAKYPGQEVSLSYKVSDGMYVRFI
jgi:uncharacterized protein